MRELKEWQRKLDHRLMHLLARHLPDAEQVPHTLSVLLRFEGTGEALESLPCTVRTISGDVATATVRLVDVPLLARAPAILFIELAAIGPR